MVLRLAYALMRNPFQYFDWQLVENRFKMTPYDEC